MTSKFFHVQALRRCYSSVNQVNIVARAVAAPTNIPLNRFRRCCHHGHIRPFNVVPRQVICERTLDRQYSASTYLHSQKSSSNFDTVADGAVSNRALFKSIEINPSVLSYIKNIGVGKRQVKKYRKTKTFVSARNGSRGGRTKNDKHGRRLKNHNPTLSVRDEKEFFAQSSSMSGRRQARGKRSNVTMSHHSMNQDTAGNASTCRWLPPPPFSSSGIMAINSHNDTQNIDHSNISDKIRVKKLPIKVLGSAGSSKDDMPRSSKSLPEVAIVGRSNVGKSTLLNALLYGNQFDTTTTTTSITVGLDNEEIQQQQQQKGHVLAPQNRKFVRGKTPEGTKIQKGAKAVVSDKPGETKRITFYQLSSQIIIEQEQQHIQTTNNQKGKNKNNGGYKMSLVLTDLPGYGFAYTSEERAKEWRDLMTSFLVNRDKSLRRILLLIDARHGFKKADFDFLETLQNLRMESTDTDSHDGVLGGDEGGRNARQKRKKRITLPPIQIILTKGDLVTQNDLARRVVQVRQQLSDSLIREPSSLPVMVCSAKAGLGYNNIRGEVARGGILEIQRELAALVPRREKLK
eukprot:CAMPEP_0203669490 /NCGR_PEP_ID=MMETSP0090-20130426/5854_1 /ASSEMBLY_ACC=CAM_ASM_001088 /TAXON_ID=426623 /ORGANISM="Chaetoceros affinis, Strain CCMP159" /LENGTH=572 /DNA_ID=CAMNT_0050534193 /DNA_START=1 /DNA_END=1719 /DNA_ORIENTATION=-